LNFVDSNRLQCYPIRKFIDNERACDLTFAWSLAEQINQTVTQYCDFSNLKDRFISAATLLKCLNETGYSMLLDVFLWYVFTTDGFALPKLTPLRFSEDRSLGCIVVAGFMRNDVFTFRSEMSTLRSFIHDEYLCVGCGLVKKDVSDDNFCASCSRNVVARLQSGKNVTFALKWRVAQEDFSCTTNKVGNACVVVLSLCEDTTVVCRNFKDPMQVGSKSSSSTTPHIKRFVSGGLLENTGSCASKFEEQTEENGVLSSDSEQEIEESDSNTPPNVELEGVNHEDRRDDDESQGDITSGALDDPPASSKPFLDRDDLLSDAISSLDEQVAEDLTMWMNPTKREEAWATVKKVVRKIFIGPWWLCVALYEYMRFSTVTPIEEVLGVLIPVILFWAPVLLLLWAIVQAAYVSVQRFRNRTVEHKCYAESLTLESVAADTIRTVPAISDSLAFSFFKSPGSLVTGLTAGVSCILAVSAYVCKTGAPKLPSVDRSFLLDFLSDHWSQIDQVTRIAFADQARNGSFSPLWCEGLCYPCSVLCSDTSKQWIVNHYPVFAHHADQLVSGPNIVFGQLPAIACECRSKIRISQYKQKSLHTDVFERMNALDASCSRGVIGEWAAQPTFTTVLAAPPNFKVLYKRTRESVIQLWTLGFIAALITGVFFLVVTVVLIFYGHVLEGEEHRKQKKRLMLQQPKQQLEIESVVTPQPAQNKPQVTPDQERPVPHFGMSALLRRVQELDSDLLPFIPEGSGDTRHKKGGAERARRSGKRIYHNLVDDAPVFRQKLNRITARAVASALEEAEDLYIRLKADERENGVDVDSVLLHDTADALLAYVEQFRSFYDYIGKRDGVAAGTLNVSAIGEMMNHGLISNTHKDFFQAVAEKLGTTPQILASTMMKINALAEIEEKQEQQELAASKAEVIPTPVIPHRDVEQPKSVVAPQKKQKTQKAPAVVRKNGMSEQEERFAQYLARENPDAKPLGLKFLRAALARHLKNNPMFMSESTNSDADSITNEDLLDLALFDKHKNPEQVFVGCKGGIRFVVRVFRKELDGFTEEAVSKHAILRRAQKLAKTRQSPPQTVHPPKYSKQESGPKAIKPRAPQKTVKSEFIWTNENAHTPSGATKMVTFAKVASRDGIIVKEGCNAANPVVDLRSVDTTWAIRHASDSHWVGCGFFHNTNHFVTAKHVVLAASLQRKSPHTTVKIRSVSGAIDLMINVIDIILHPHLDLAVLRVKALPEGVRPCGVSSVKLSSTPIHGVVYGIDGPKQLFNQQGSGKLWSNDGTLVDSECPTAKKGGFSGAPYLVENKFVGIHLGMCKDTTEDNSPTASPVHNGGLTSQVIEAWLSSFTKNFKPSQ
jgi:hypothetical protein